ncbi:hypothetical protein Xets_01088 [Xenorhabdus sp. TS4]|nr:hypothetical protein [Xenorhabdus sp. TS4]
MVEKPTIIITDNSLFLLMKQKRDHYHLPVSQPDEHFPGKLLIRLSSSESLELKKPLKSK